MTDDEARRQALWVRRNLVGLALTLAFCGGVLCGLVAASVGLPPVWWAPMIVLGSAGFFAYLNLGRGGPGGRRSDG